MAPRICNAFATRDMCSRFYPPKASTACGRACRRNVAAIYTHVTSVCVGGMAFIQVWLSNLKLLVLFQQRAYGASFVT
jgi:hypothetical protein